MKIRAITHKDLGPITNINEGAFKDDELNAFFYPGKDKYPGDLRRYQILRLRTRFVTKGMHGVVVETEGDKPEIAGYAMNLRLGDDEEAGKWMEDSWGCALERTLLKLEGWYDRTFTDRARSSKNIQRFQTASGWNSLDVYKNRWHISILAVSPAHQRRGVGAMLVQHAQRLAAEDRVPLTLESSMMGKAMYMKQGLEVVSEVNVAEGFDSICMAWVPEGLEGIRERV
ncbi:unnamed protein product [Periconia digitata]|uniref:N-acetyltransferase domain-containing protein n=1 Tax=Periconia digitata TaxID=1303443 RepID=A0A9W4UTG8_9PLEO|nr:unnamed protein product [Periconia digitata]